MIARISKGSSLYGALTYNQEKVDEGVGKVLGANIINQPLDGQFRISDCMEDFKNWMPSHYRTENPVVHISLNPHPDDRLTDQQLFEIGEQYMQELGYGSQPYVIYKHEDIDRHHIHIVSLCVDSNGKKIDDSFEHLRSKEITQNIEQKYRLHPAENTDNPQEEWELSPVDTTKGNLKHQISNILAPIMDMYRFRTIGEYRALLSLYNISVEEVKGESKGRKYNGLIYSALDKDGNKYGPPLKSSLFGKAPGYSALKLLMQDNVALFKSPKGKREVERCRIKVAQAMASAITENEFRRQLRSQHLDVVFRRNESGRIYGVTFIDHTSRQVLNGSLLGKDYSANKFNDWLVNNIPPETAALTHPDAVKPLLTSGRSDERQTNDSRTDWRDNSRQPLQDFPGSDWEHNSSPQGDAISLFAPVPGSPTDEPMPRKKRKKKKRKPGRQD